MGHSGDVQTEPETTQAVRSLREPRNRVHPRARRWWTIRAVLAVGVLLVPQVIVWATTGQGWPVVTLIVTVLLGAGYVVAMPWLRYRIHRWESSPEAVYTRSGWLTLEWRVAPVSRIQTIDTERGPLQQLLRLATVTITTASAAGPVRIAGLHAEDAAELAETLTAATNLAPGDAT